MADIEIVDSGDVHVEPLPKEICERCEDSVEAGEEPVAATQIVTLDIRELSREVTIGIYCDKCAGEVAAELQSALPPEEIYDEHTGVRVR